MTLIKRSADEILADAIKRIGTNTPVTNFKPGAIARAISESMKDELPLIYDYAEETLNMGFISKAKDKYLDLIGALFSYPRRTVTVADASGNLTSSLIDNETYRYEITQRVLVMANANETALRLILLIVPGVADVIGKEYTQGTGSFSFTIIPEYGFTLTAIKAGVEDAVQQAKAFGVRPNIIFPIQIPMELTLRISFNESATGAEKDFFCTSLRAALFKYFGGFDKGQGFIYNDFVQQVMSISSKVVDFSVIRFYLNNQPALLTNQNILDDEMIVPAYIEVQ